MVTGEKFTRAVDLVIEITSHGKVNRERDLMVKRQLYAKYGMNEYWIVDTENHSVLMYRLREQALAETAMATGDDEITSHLLPEFHLTVNRIFNF